MTRPDLDAIVLTPAGDADATLAVAGSRAGAIGVLNLEFVRDPDAALPSLKRLAAYGRGRLGVLVDSGADDVFRTVLGGGPAEISTIILTSSDRRRLATQVGEIHSAGKRALLVVNDIAQAAAGRKAGVDGLIAKGHEAGGWVGEETAFVLLQRLTANFDLPIWLQGGIGLHTAAAAFVGGATGVVLDNQLLLTRESPLPEAMRERIRSMDGSETLCLGTALGAALRVYTRPNLIPVDDLRQVEADCLLSEDGTEDRADVERYWRSAVRDRVGWSDPERHVLALGQDASFAADLARRFVTVGGVVAALRQSVTEHRARVVTANPLAEGSSLAQSHGTRYPLVQGPMTRVSDRAEFAAEVAEAGALPFLALALMRAPDVRRLLEETQQRLGDRPWGVGILGFVPPELRAEQLEVLRAYKPPFALIAGGRPDQARVLDADGIATYLHVPSPGLLRMYLKDGARRFVFEGRECGGHVGPRTSFVLWEAMIQVLLDELPSGAPAGDVHVLFAGGIHDGQSAAMVAAMAAPLASRGIRVGVLVGTAYLFTEEAVRAGAITAEFQRAAVACEQTVLLESGPGHATRCVPSPYASDFEREKRQIVQQRLPAAELRDRLEALNVGRLRIASKGLDRNPEHNQDPTVPRLVAVGAEEQWARGLYMIGQSAALRDRVCSLAELHAEISEGSTARLGSTAEVEIEIEAPAPPPAAVAIVGIGTILPGASDLRTFWSNILNKVDSITEVPPSRWDWHQYYDPNRAARDKVYSRWGGFIDDIPFDPITYGMPPSSLASIEPFQLLGLAVVRAALDDAGYLDRPFARERTSVILGAGGGGGDLSGNYVVRSSLAGLFGESAPELIDGLGGALPEWTEDSFAGILMNVAAGRVANRFDLGGVNYTIDAACASSLAAVYLAVRDLEAGTSDTVLVGGIDAIQNPFSYLCFSKTQALSPTGRCRPFDAQADGIAISEGFVALVLKRLEDAERDGDRIYAVIRGVGGSSDGRDRSLTAPRPEGQIRALRRAYAQARIDPATVGLVEAHGTGTVAGDQAEVQALSTFFRQSGAGVQQCAIGSVKSMIGHTKATAGVAGLTKVALALHHRILPPTLGVTQPNPKARFADSPLYVNTEARPWVQDVSVHPRRAGVSAFGFGGTNFHVVVEEYLGDYLPEPSTTTETWPAELLVWRGRSRAEIADSVQFVLDQIEAGAMPELRDLAYSLARKAARIEVGLPALSVVAESLAELPEKLRAALAVLRGTAPREHRPQGIHFSDEPLANSGKIAYLFPGQGSQYVNMARELAAAFPEARAWFDKADSALAGRFEQPLSRYIFPPPTFAPENEKRQQAALTETNVAQPALGAIELALSGLLGRLGVEPEMTAGHSYGEFVALHAASCFDAATLLRLSEARGRFMREGAGQESGTMAAIMAAPDDLSDLLTDSEITLANLNSPRQTVISGTRAGVERAVQWCAERNLRVQRLQVACAFHSPLVAPAQRRLAELLAETPIVPPRLPVYSNTTASEYPADREAISAILADHLIRPVEWVREIEAMYAAGARVFVEVGPRNVLSGLVDRTLGERAHLCVPLDQSGKPGLAAFLNGVAALVAEGFGVEVVRLFEGRQAREIDLAQLARAGEPATHSPTTWLINGGGAWPISKTAEAKAPLKPLRVAIASKSAPALAYSGASVGIHSQRAPIETQSTPNGHDASAPHSQTNGRHDVQAHGTSSHSMSAGEDSTGEIPARPQERAGSMGTTEQREVIHPPGGDIAEQASHDQPGIPAMSAQYAPAAEPSGEVMSQFQSVMQRFLDTQQAVMLAYLTGQRPARPAAATSMQPLPRRAPIAQPPVRGAPAAMQTVAPPPSPATLPSQVGTASSAPAQQPPLVATPEQHLNGGAAHARVQAENGPPVVASPEPRVPAAPDEPEVVPPPAAAASSEVPTRTQLTDQLLAVVSERTGYPPEMLGLDADVEADLGIDSIKRVEIAGTILQSLPIPPGVEPDIEAITASRTLRQVIDAFEALLAPATVAAALAGASNGVEVAEEGRRPFDGEPAGAGIGRFTLRVIPAAPPLPRAGLAQEGVVLVIGDRDGAGSALTATLKQQGHKVARLHIGEAPASETELSVPLLDSPEAAAALVERIHADYGPVSALIHLASPADGTNLDAASWPNRLGRGVTSLFLLTQALRGDLERAATNGGAAVVGVTWLGGSFVSTGGIAAFDPSQGSLVGFLKTLAHEWPLVRVKAVDFGNKETSRITDIICDELLAADGLVEVGYRGQERVRLELSPAPFDDTGAPPLDCDSVVLITGGARGITAEVALRLAERYGSTLLLVGRTPPPTTDEPADTSGLSEPRALKQALIEQFRRAGRQVTPAAIEDAYRRLLQERELRSNLARLRATGARVEYLPCDVQDASAFRALLEATYETYGRIDGVIHGAGIIEDKLLRDKQLASFRRVLATKADSSLVLASALRPETLRFLVFFSSVSGRFGNRGQCDYAAASEVLNKLALWLDRRWPGRVVSINWGPWLTAGMVSPEVQRQFAERGVTLIPVDEGCRRLDEELRAGRKGEVEVVIGGAQGMESQPVQRGAAATTITARERVVPVTGGRLRSHPLLATSIPVRQDAEGTFELLRTLDIRQDLYLNDHRIDGQPVLPFAVAMELMAETAAACRPDLDVLAVREVRLLRGVTVARETPIRLAASIRLRGDHHVVAVDSTTLTLELSIASAADPATIHYRALVDLGPHDANRRGAPPVDLPGLDDARLLPMSLAEVYDRWLFHGPLMRGIVSVESIGSGGASATLRPSIPAACLADAAAGGWLIDPVMIDSAFQMQVIWARMHWDVTLLPAQVGSYVRSAPLRINGGEAIRYELRLRPESQAPLCHADHCFFDNHGRLIGTLCDVVGAGSKALNRLAGTR